MFISSFYSVLIHFCSIALFCTKMHKSSIQELIFCSWPFQSISIIPTLLTQYVRLVYATKQPFYNHLRCFLTFKPFLALKPFKLTQAIAIFCSNGFQTIFMHSSNFNTSINTCSCLHNMPLEPFH